MPPAEIWINGLTQSCTYMTLAFGLVLVLSILGMLNWAHGQFYMLGAFVVHYAVTAGGIPFPISLLISAVVIGALGMVVTKFIIERLTASSAGGAVYVTVATIALIFFFEGVAGMVFGLQPKGLAKVLPGLLDLGSFSVSYSKIFIVIFTLVIMIAMYIVLNSTKIGLAIRAVAQEPGAASLYGVNVKQVSVMVMGIGCALAAMAGGITAPLYVIHPFMGRTTMMMSLLAIIMGGLGSLTGAIVGGLILGFLNSIIAYYVSSLSELMLFLLVIAILLVRPQGLFGASLK
jgi:branched-chain amino acid transport system permease protein